MSEFTCPNCRGEFPEPTMDARANEPDAQCPWCEQSLDGSYEVPDGPRIVSRTTSNDDYEPQGLIQRLF